MASAIAALVALIFGAGAASAAYVGSSALRRRTSPQGPEHRGRSAVVPACVTRVVGAAFLVMGLAAAVSCNRDAGRDAPATSGGSRARPPAGVATPPPRTASVASPSGWCEAYVVAWSEENSQVVLEFDGGACGSGAVSAFGRAPRLALRWLDPTTLEVEHSASVRMERNASGEIIPCGGPGRSVRVVLAPR